MGIIKQTTVNFVVHNFEDFDSIYNKYFLKPGAQLFVDFGWSSIENLYNPRELIESGNIQEFLFQRGGVVDDPATQTQMAKPDGVVTANQGDLEVIQGIVTNYDAKITKEGSVECSVTLTSSNSALLNFKTGQKKSRIKSILTHGILYYGIKSAIDDLGGDEDLKQFMMTPNRSGDNSAQAVTNYLDNLEILAKKVLGDRGFTPGLNQNLEKNSNNAVRTGVFVSSLDVDDAYISWGFFEDFLMNTQFGFGQDENDINDGTNLQIKMNSSNSFTTFNKHFIDKQRALSSVPEGAPDFVYPNWWGDSDPEDGEKIYGGGSYSYQKSRYPDIFYPFHGDYENHTDFDKNKIHGSTTIGRIPIREVFVNVDIISTAFSSNENVHKAINQILGKLNKASDGVFNWSLIKGETDSQLHIVDTYYSDKFIEEYDYNITENSYIEKADEQQEDLFTFNIMSPNSIISDYNLSFKLPPGDIGNMHMINAMGHENSIFPVDDDLDDVVAIASMDNDFSSLVYEPDYGPYRMEQENAGEDGDTFNVYNTIDKIMDTNPYKINTVKEQNLIKSKMIGTNATDKKPEPPKETDIETKAQDYVKINDEALISQGFRVTKTIKEYYSLIGYDEVVHNYRPNMLPYELTLTTYGIGSIVPGDTFKVDYLPKVHLKNTYLQTKKVSHNIGPTGWTTTLNTTYRIKPREKSNIYKKLPDRDNIVLSPSFLQGLNLPNGSTNDGYFWDSEVTTTQLIPYMTKLKIVQKDYLDASSLLLEFTCTKKMADLFENELQMINYAVPSIGDSFWDGENEAWVYPGGRSRNDIDTSQTDEVDPATIPLNFRRQNHEYLRTRNKNTSAWNIKWKNQEWDKLYEVNAFSNNDTMYIPPAIKDQCYKEFWAYSGTPIDYETKRTTAAQDTDLQEYRSVIFYTPPPVVLRPQQKYYMYIRGNNYYFLDLKHGPTGKGESVEYILRMFDKSSVYPKQANS